MAAVPNRLRWTILLLLGLPAMVSCSGGTHEHPVSPRAQRLATLRLATTTSTRDSGLLDQLLPAFERSHACRVDVIAVGSGAALKLGAAGDAHVLLVHAPCAEKDFMAAGHGVRREPLMYNYFTILGPVEDPAEIRGQTPHDALRKIADGKHRFLSRGDASGTHQRELLLWQAAGGLTPWDSYIETGQGMGETLVIADEMRAYTLADEGTYRNYQDKTELAMLVSFHESLRNLYSVIKVNPGNSGGMNEALADALIEFFISPEIQQWIGEYRVANQPLFKPNAPPE